MKPIVPILAPGQITDPNLLTIDEIRQGETGHGVRYMLIVSLATALLALGAVWFFVSK